MHVTTVGIDLAKQMFHVHGTDAQGREVFRKRLSRPALNSWPPYRPASSG